MWARWMKEYNDNVNLVFVWCDDCIVYDYDFCGLMVDLFVMVVNWLVMVLKVWTYASRARRDVDFVKFVVSFNVGVWMLFLVCVCLSFFVVVVVCCFE